LSATGCPIFQFFGGGGVGGGGGEGGRAGYFHILVILGMCGGIGYSFFPHLSKIYGSIPRDKMINFFFQASERAGILNPQI